MQQVDVDDGACFNVFEANRRFWVAGAGDSGRWANVGDPRAITREQTRFFLLLTSKIITTRVCEACHYDDGTDYTGEKQITRNSNRPYFQ